MSREFPELTTIGALFGFARRLEQASAEVLDAAADREPDGARADDFRKMAKKHRRRSDDIERIRQERLNETVLEPLTNMARDEYAPSLEEDLGSLDAAALRQAAIDLEQCAAKFYTDAVDKAGPVLAEMRRSLSRLAKDNDKFVATLRQG